MKRILVINPIATEEWNESDREYFKKYASENTVVDITNIEKGPKTIESQKDESDCIPGILEILKKNNGKYDGFIINCFLGPGVEEGRKAVDVPVISPGEVSFYMASLLCDNFGVVSPMEEVGRIVKTMVHKIGLENKFAGVSELNLGVDDLLMNPKDTKKKIISSIRKLTDDLNAEAIIFGCTGLVSFAEDIKSEIDVPLIEPSATSLKVLELLINLRN